MPLFSGRSRHQKTDQRSVFLVVLLLAPAVWAETLTRERVVELVRANSPAVRLAKSRAEEVQAQQVGAGALAQNNPVVSATVGPRFIPSTGTAVDANVSLSWPLEFFGVPGTKKALADERAHAAAAEVDDATRLALLDALLLWSTTQQLDARLALEVSRVSLDTELLRIAKARRAAGSVGDADVALALVLSAEGQARLETTRGEVAATQHQLRARLGLAPDDPLTLPALENEQADAPELAAALARVERHPALARALATAAAEQTNAELQRKTGLPVPRLLVNGEHSPEYTARAGLEVPLPLYQRNQTEQAIATARARTAALEVDTTRAQLEADFRAAHARLVAARAVLITLERSSAAVADAEHLVTRGYELGQASLSEVVSARREANAARAALVDARAGLVRARTLFHLVTGVPP